MLEPKVFSDDRGFFLESYNEKTFREIGIPDKFVQDNHSFSKRGVLRGLHYQVEKPQGKLVRVVSGEVLDVFVDLRRSSVSFKRWQGVRLSGENQRMAGFRRALPMASTCYRKELTSCIRPLNSISPNWNALCSGTIPI